MVLFLRPLTHFELWWGPKNGRTFPTVFETEAQKIGGELQATFHRRFPQKAPGEAPESAGTQQETFQAQERQAPSTEGGGAQTKTRSGKLPQGAEETDAPLRTHPEAPNGRRRRKPQKKIPKAAGTLNKAKPGTQAPQVPPPQDTAHPSPAPRTRNTTHRQRMLQTTEWSARPHMPRDDPAFTHKFRLGKIIETLN